MERGILFIDTRVLSLISIILDNTKWRNSNSKIYYTIKYMHTQRYKQIIEEREKERGR